MGWTEPPAMPYEFWTSDRYHEPFASHDIGRVLRAFRTDPRHEEKYGEGRITQNLLGSWLGLSQEKLSRIEHGHTPIDSLSTLIEWARKLSIPQEFLWFEYPPNEDGEPHDEAPQSAADLLPFEIRRLRKKAGLSQRELAHLIGYTREYISIAERRGGNIPSRELVRALDSTLGADGTLVEIRAKAKREQQTLHREHQSHETHRRDFLTSSLMVSIGALIPMPVSGRRVGSDLVSQLRQRNARLRRLDDFIGGADTFSLYKAELDSTVEIFKDSSHSEVTSKGLLSVIAEQAQQAGWAAFDAGQHADARHLFEVALSAAKDSGDSALVGNSWAYMAYQEVSLGNSGVEMAINSYKVAGTDAPPKVQALLLERLAWTYAKEERAEDAERTLAEAADILDRANNGESPHWASWVNDQEIKIMTGRCWTELHRPMRAILVLEDALSEFSDDHARDKSLYMSWLADAYFDAREIEQAANVAERVLDLSTGVGSVRPQQRIESFAKRLIPYRRIEPVSRLLDRLSM